MKRHGSALVVVVIFALALSGCSPAQLNGEDDVSLYDQVAEERGEQKEGTIEIEGMAEQLRSKLYVSPEDWPLPFSTFVPEDLMAEDHSSEDGYEARFVANFGDERNDDAYLEVFIYPEGTSEDEASGSVEELAAAFEASEVGENDDNGGGAYDWSITEYTGMTDNTIVRLALGQHGEHFFHVLLHYPAEFADGLAPRAARILDELRWEDTGESLA